jgi:hypothetical protein
MRVGHAAKAPVRSQDRVSVYSFAVDPDQE